MSTSLSRRDRLAVAHELPAMRCPGCGVLLERVAFVKAHLRRCDRRLAEQQRRPPA